MIQILTMEGAMDDDGAKKERFDQCQFLLSDPSLATIPVAAQFARWMWAIEARPEERLLFQNLSATTLGRMLLAAMVEPGGCDPGAAGVEARRRSRALWARQFISSRSGERVDPLAEDDPWTKAPKNAPALPLALGRASLAAEKSLAPIAGCAATWTAASAVLPGASPETALGLGMATFGALCVGFAAKILNRSRLSPMVAWRLERLRETYPDLAAEGALATPQWNFGPNSSHSNFSEAKALRDALFSPQAVPTWVDREERALIERFELRSQAQGLAAPLASPRARL